MLVISDTLDKTDIWTLRVFFQVLLSSHFSVFGSSGSFISHLSSYNLPIQFCCLHDFNTELGPWW